MKTQSILGELHELHVDNVRRFFNSIKLETHKFDIMERATDNGRSDCLILETTQRWYKILVMNAKGKGVNISAQGL
jgi:hypothetical protein